MFARTWDSNVGIFVASSDKAPSSYFSREVRLLLHQYVTNPPSNPHKEVPTKCSSFCGTCQVLELLTGSLPMLNATCLRHTYQIVRRNMDLSIDTGMGLSEMFNAVENLRLSTRSPRPPFNIRRCIVTNRSSPRPPICIFGVPGGSLQSIAFPISLPYFRQSGVVSPLRHINGVGPSRARMGAPPFYCSCSRPSLIYHCFPATD